MLAHDKSYVMELHNQASKTSIENPQVKELKPLQMKKDASSKKRKSDHTSPKSPLIDHSKKRRQTTDVQLIDNCKICNIMIQENFEEHLYNSHYKQKLKSVIPKQTRECSGKNTFIILLCPDNTGLLELLLSIKVRKYSYPGAMIDDTYQN